MSLGHTHFSIFSVLDTTPLVPSKNFRENMEKISEKQTDLDYFMKFHENPRTADNKVIQGAHRFIALAIKNQTNLPKNAVLIDIFREFLEEEVRDYVFTRMTKPILLELALCILQDLARGGPDRAKSLFLVVEKTESGGKTVVLPDKKKGRHDEDEHDAPEIDGASFLLADKTGSSPDFKFHSGKGREAPYKKPDADGYFTPKKSKRSLQREIEVKIH